MEQPCRLGCSNELSTVTVRYQFHRPGLMAEYGVEFCFPDFLSIGLALVVGSTA